MKIIQEPGYLLITSYFSSTLCYICKIQKPSFYFNNFLKLLFIRGVVLPLCKRKSTLWGKIMQVRRTFWVEEWSDIGRWQQPGSLFAVGSRAFLMWKYFKQSWKKSISFKIHVLWLVQCLSVHSCGVSAIKDQVQASQGSIKLIFSFLRSIQDIPPNRSSY